MKLKTRFSNVMHDVDSTVSEKKRKKRKEKKKDEFYFFLHRLTLIDSFSYMKDEEYYSTVSWLLV